MKLFDRLLLVGSPSEDDFQREVEANPSRAIEILDKFVSHRSYRQLSKNIPDTKERFHHEWIINPFQFVRQAIEPEHYFEFAKYLSQSEVWSDAAPHFCDNSVWTRVILPMLDGIPDHQKPELVRELNSRGLLSDCFSSLGITPEIAKRRWAISL